MTRSQAGPEFWMYLATVIDHACPSHRTSRRGNWFTLTPPFAEAAANLPKYKVMVRDVFHDLIANDKIEAFIGIGPPVLSSDQSQSVSPINSWVPSCQIAPGLLEIARLLLARVGDIQAEGL